MNANNCYRCRWLVIGWISEYVFAISRCIRVSMSAAKMSIFSWNIFGVIASLVLCVHACLLWHFRTRPINTEKEKWQGNEFPPSSINIYCAFAYSVTSILLYLLIVCEFNGFISISHSLCCKAILLCKSRFYCHSCGWADAAYEQTRNESACAWLSHEVVSLRVHKWIESFHPFPLFHRLYILMMFCKGKKYYSNAVVAGTKSTATHIDSFILNSVLCHRKQNNRNSNEMFPSDNNALFMFTTALAINSTY